MALFSLVSEYVAVGYDIYLTVPCDGECSIPILQMTHLGTG